MKRQIVRRTYSVLNGAPSKKVSYITSPMDATGREAEGNVDDAYIFNPDAMIYPNQHYSNQTISGNDRDGDYSYKQEVLNLRIQIEI